MRPQDPYGFGSPPSTGTAKTGAASPHCLPNSRFPITYYPFPIPNSQQKKSVDNLLFHRL
ncbi:MAG: hypothetical protein KME31_09685 [Tolypothrix carrinoi HA7290-LM1]|nr:hypothetical protein [Tolypothrix carrinoi HA7290-LM1]